MFNCNYKLTIENLDNGKSYCMYFDKQECLQDVLSAITYRKKSFNIKVTSLRD